MHFRPPFTHMLKLLVQTPLILTTLFTAHPGLAHDLPVNFGGSGNRLALEFKNTSLETALEEVQQKSGIAFKVPDEFKNRPITISVSGANWIEAVKSMLRDYDIVELGGPELSTTQIWLVGEKAGVSTLGKTFHSSQRKNTVIPRFKLLTRFPPGMTLPSVLFENPKIQAFLKENDIHSREEWKDFRKARVVREKAKEHLEQLLLRNQNH
ncbi:MAG: hypothetical protein F3745_05460 [Nitrospinae bacterium]|nr:hypothetical protein [Nitrospinota bacterium]